MGIRVEIDKNVFLREIRDNALAQGRAEGRAEGKAEGVRATLRDLLELKFGPLPKWAKDRLSKARTSQTEQWKKKVLTATTLEGAIGKR